MLVIDPVCMSRQRGFTLIEAVIGIVIMGVAMMILLTLLFPQAERSATPHYQVRAAALAHATMTEILSKNFDNSSDPNGGYIRCGEDDLAGNPTTCTTPDNLGNDGKAAGAFTDVDDYIGCWRTNSSGCADVPAGTPIGLLNDVFGDDMISEYPNFTLIIEVFYDGNFDGVDDELIRDFKRINLTVDTSRYGVYEFNAYRGNY